MIFYLLNIFMEPDKYFLFQGYIPAFVRLGPQTILTFVFFEQLRMNFGTIPTWAQTPCLPLLGRQPSHRQPTQWIILGAFVLQHHTSLVIFCSSETYRFVIFIVDFLASTVYATPSGIKFIHALYNTLLNDYNFKMGIIKIDWHGRYFRRRHIQ